MDISCRADEEELGEEKDAQGIVVVGVEVEVCPWRYGGGCHLLFIARNDLIDGIIGSGMEESFEGGLQFRMIEW